jgi:hypothetical protein
MLSAAIVVTPSTVVNARDCGALVTIAAAFSILLSLLIYAARLSTRWPWRTLLGYDDLVTSVATVCSLHVYVNHDLIRLQALSVAQSVVAIRAVSAGLGVVPEDLSESAQQHAGKVCRKLAINTTTNQRSTDQKSIARFRSGDNLHGRRLCVQDRSQPFTASSR